MVRLRLVDDVNGEPSHVLLHYCRAFHHLYQELLETLDDDVKVTVVAPDLPNDANDIACITPGGIVLPDFEHGTPYTLDLFIDEMVRGKHPKFEPLLSALAQSSPMIFKDEYDGVSHPSELLSHPGLEVHVVDHQVHPFVRDLGFACEDKRILRGNKITATRRPGGLPEEILRAKGFKIKRPLNFRQYDDGGEIITSGNVIYASQSLVHLNEQTYAQVGAVMHRISKGRKISVVPLGVTYHLDGHFAVPQDETVCIADLAAGRRIMEENGLILSEEECYSSVVSDAWGLSFQTRQEVADQTARELSKICKVFRVPVFAFSVGGEDPEAHRFELSSLNLVSTDSKLRVPFYEIPGVDEVREKMDEIGRYVGKEVVSLRKNGAYNLRNASIRCLFGNLARAYS